MNDLVNEVVHVLDVKMLGNAVISLTSARYFSFAKQNEMPV